MGETLQSNNQEEFSHKYFLLGTRYWLYAMAHVLRVPFSNWPNEGDFRTILGSKRVGMGRETIRLNKDSIY